MLNRTTIKNITINRSGIENLHGGYYFTITYLDDSKKINFLQPYELIEEYGKYLNLMDPLVIDIIESHRVTKKIIEECQSAPPSTLPWGKIEPAYEILPPVSIELEEKQRERSIKSLKVDLPKKQIELKENEKLTDEFIVTFHFKTGKEKTQVMTGNNIVNSYREYLDKPAKSFFQKQINSAEKAIFGSYNKKRKDVAEGITFSWEGSLPTKPMPSYSSHNTDDILVEGELQYTEKGKAYYEKSPSPERNKKKTKASSADPDSSVIVLDDSSDEDELAGGENVSSKTPVSVTQCKSSMFSSSSENDEKEIQAVKILSKSMTEKFPPSSNWEKYKLEITMKDGSKKEENIEKAEAITRYGKHLYNTEKNKEVERVNPLKR